MEQKNDSCVVRWVHSLFSPKFEGRIRCDKEKNKNGDTHYFSKEYTGIVPFVRKVSYGSEQGRT